MYKSNSYFHMTMEHCNDPKNSCAAKYRQAVQVYA